MADAPKVSWLQVLEVARHLIENPEDWPDFKQRFGLATVQAAVKLAEKHGLPPEILAKLKRDLGLE